MKRIIDLKGFQRSIYLAMNFSALVSLKVSVPVGLGSSFEIDSFNLCLNTLKVKFSNELFSVWRLQVSILILVNINYNIMKLCGVFTIWNLCKTDLKIGGVVKYRILASTKRTKVFLFFYCGHRLRWGTGLSNKKV